MKTLLLILSLGVLTIGLSGCTKSFLGVALESMTVSKVDDYFDLEGPQKEQLKKDVQKDLKELRQDVFPQIAKSLRQLDSQIGKDSVQEPSIAKIFEDSESYLKKATIKFESTAVKTAATLSEEQFQHFAREIRDDIEESQEETKSADGSLKQSMKRYTKSIEFWVGNLSYDQKSRLREFLKNHPYPWSLQNRSKYVVLDKFLNSRKNPDELKKFVKGFATDYDEYRLPEFKEALKVHQAAFQDFFANDLWPTFEVAQRLELKDNLRTRAENLEFLARN
jgi:hypothetical protein